MAEVLIVLFLHVHFGLIHVDVFIEISSHLSQWKKPLLLVINFVFHILWYVL